LTTDANIQCLPSTDAPSNGDLYQRISQGSLFSKICIYDAICCPQPGFRYGSQTSISPKRISRCICYSTSHYVPNLPISCPSLWNYPAKLQTIMHLQASIHAQSCILCAHAFVKLLYHTYMLHFQSQLPTQFNVYVKTPEKFL
jgi:hypothetical protein